jgi:CRISPR-associated endonuclease/helicase Cas3
LLDDERTELGYWADLNAHLGDAKREASDLCNALGLNGPLRDAVVKAAALHDLGKAHLQWQNALPAASALRGGPWAKCPPVLAVDVGCSDAHIYNAIHNKVTSLRPDALFLGEERRQGGRKKVVRWRWAIAQRLSREQLDFLRARGGVMWAGHMAFRPGLRHEAASALAMWHRYRRASAPYPALAVYLAAAHHGKVRTVLRSRSESGSDVFGVPADSPPISFYGSAYLLDFSVAKDGAEGEWQDGQFVLTGYGWTGLVADLLGSWHPDDKSEVGVVPNSEPRRLGPFALAYLEALVHIADWRASERPSQSIKPGQVRPIAAAAAQPEVASGSEIVASGEARHE